MLKEYSKIFWVFFFFFSSRKKERKNPKYLFIGSGKRKCSEVTCVIGVTPTPQKQLQKGRAYAAQKTSCQENETSSHFASVLRKQRAMNTGTQLTSPVLISPGFQPIEWNCP